MQNSKPDMGHYISYITIVTHGVWSFFNEIYWGRSLSQIFQNCVRDSPAQFFWWLQTKSFLLAYFISKIGEEKYRYFKRKFDERTNSAHSFEEKPVLLRCNKNEINDEIIGRKEINIYWKFRLSFFASGKNIDTPNEDFCLRTKKHVL